MLATARLLLISPAATSAGGSIARTTTANIIGNGFVGISSGSVARTTTATITGVTGIVLTGTGSRTTAATITGTGAINFSKTASFTATTITTGAGVVARFNTGSHTTTATITGVGTSMNFVTRDSATGNLMLNGERFRFGGVNMPFLGLNTSDNYATHAQIDASLNSAAALNHTVIRSYNSLVGHGIAKCVEPTLGTWNDAAFEPTDYLIQQCGIRGFRLFFPFIEGGSDYGAGNTSWYCTQNGVATGGSNAPNFYTNTTVINSFKNYITHVLNHVNVYTGVAYKNDPAVLGWETGNELSPTGNWTYSAWTDTISQHIKLTCGAQQLVVAGNMTIWQDTSTKAIVDVATLQLQYLDIITDHVYWRWTSAMEQVAEAEICHQYGKAFWQGEYTWTQRDPTNGDTYWTLAEMHSAALGANVDGTAYWELLEPAQTWSGGFTLHVPPDASSGIGIPEETRRSQQISDHALAMANNDLGPTGLWIINADGDNGFNALTTRACQFNGDEPSGVWLYRPKAGDLLLLFSTIASLAGVNTSPEAGWTNILGSGGHASNSSHRIVCFQYWITTADEIAGRLNYTMTPFTGADSGGAVGVVIRGAHTATTIDDTNTASSNTAVTPNVLAGLTGSNLGDNSRVISAVSGADWTLTHTPPSGWGHLAQSTQYTPLWLGLRNTPTVAGQNVAATNITPQFATNYVSLTVAIAPMIYVPSCYPPVKRPNYGSLLQV